MKLRTWKKHRRRGAAKVLRAARRLHGSHNRWLHDATMRTWIRNVTYSTALYLATPFRRRRGAR